MASSAPASTACNKASSMSRITGLNVLAAKAVSRLSRVRASLAAARFTSSSGRNQNICYTINHMATVQGNANLEIGVGATLYCPTAETLNKDLVKEDPTSLLRAHPSPQ